MTTARAENLRALLMRRSRELGKPLTAIAKESGLSRAHLYELASGDAQDPSVRTLVRIAKALQVSPLLLFRHFADLGVSPGADWRPTNRAVGLNDVEDVAAFNADTTTPDHAVVLPGEAFRKVWEVQNLGTRPWRQRRLVRVDGEYVVARRHPDASLQVVLAPHLASLYREVPVPETSPGQPVHLAVDFAAPPENCTVASIWRLEDSDGQPCYDPSFIFHVIVTVMAR